MNIRLDSVDSWSPDIHVSILRLPALVGRDRGADVQVDDRWVSRRHCELRVADGQLLVRDLESRYGTLVNGQHIQQAPLMPGDELTLGVRTLRVSFEAPELEPGNHAETFDRPLTNSVR